MLDPTVGEGVVAAMKREVHRMELRHAELLRTQERLTQVRLDSLCRRVLHLSWQLCHEEALNLLAAVQLCHCCSVTAVRLLLGFD
jgi:hypothetical protein